MKFCYEIEVQVSMEDTVYCGLPAAGIKYYGFMKPGATGNKFGWYAMHFDDQFNLLLDGVAINNDVNKPILAGVY